MKLEEVVLLAGGQVDRGALPPAILPDQYDLFANWLTWVQTLVDPLAQGAASARVEIVQVNSPSMVCRVRMLGDETAALVVPLGALARTRVWARMLLQWFDEDRDKPTMKVVASILDDFAESDWEIAPLLVPLFGEMRDESKHWSQLAIIDSRVSLVDRLELAVTDVVWTSVIYLVMHEVAHVMRRHLVLGKRPTSGPDERTIRRALEIDADATAAYLLVFCVLEKINTASDEAGAFESAFHWVGYALALLFGLYDSRRKALDLYSAAYYPHPVVRHRLFTSYARICLAQQRPDLLGAWDSGQNEGLAACVRALWSIDVETLKGRYGGSKEEVARFVPVTALNFAEFDSTYVIEQVEMEDARTRRVLEAIGR